MAETDKAEPHCEFLSEIEVHAYSSFEVYVWLDPTVKPHFPIRGSCIHLAHNDDGVSRTHMLSAKAARELSRALERAANRLEAL
jgi:hypothetical protein